MADNYQLQALYFASVVHQEAGVVACVHLENNEDKMFWEPMLQKQQTGRYYFITHSRSNKGKETSGSKQCLNYLPYLSKEFFICIDSDLRYLLQEPNLDADHYVCQTYTYSWENHYCEAKNLQERFNAVCFDGAARFDFGQFLSDYSKAVYLPLLLLLYCIRNGKEEFGQKIFRECLHVQWSHHDLENSGIMIAEKIARNFEPYVNATFAKSIDWNEEKAYFKLLNVTEQNAYLHIRGHEVYNLVLSIGKLLYKPFEKDVLKDALPKFNYWQIEKVGNDAKQILQV